jgi:hypothetical protein
MADILLRILHEGVEEFCECVMDHDLVRELWWRGIRANHVLDDGQVRKSFDWSIYVNVLSKLKLVLVLGHYGCNDELALYWLQSIQATYELWHVVSLHIPLCFVMMGAG